MIRIIKISKSAGICGFLAVVVMLFMSPLPCRAQEETIDSIYTDEINLIKGELVTVKGYSMTRVSVTDPDVVDIVDAGDQELLLVGKTAGQSALFIWDEHGKRTIMLNVFNQNLDLVKSRLQKLLKTGNIHEITLDINPQESKVVLSGELPDYKRTLYDEIVEPFSEDVINLVKDEKIEDLVQIDMQLTELNETLSKSLGIDWTTGGRTGIAPNYEERQWPTDGHIRDFFKIGEFNRTGQLVAAVNALITEGKGRVLSKPKLVVVSGEEASFLVGGEIPVRTTTSSATGTQENVEFKEFGISMTITPTIRKQKVDIIMNLEISEIDASTAQTVSQNVAFSTRSASTRLLLDDGQTIVLAGLIKKTSSQTLSKIPFIGDVPILGLLFRSRVNPIPEQDQELVIALTPHIMRQQEEGLEAKKKSAPDPSLAVLDQAKQAAYATQQKMVLHYSGIPGEMTDYVRDIQQKISQAIVYPSEAKQYGWEGTVKVGMLILNDGTLAFALVKESSGHEIFDEVALNTAKRMAPFRAFPSDTDLQELNVTIPIVYSLNKN
jgi:pilus assembly protein CpaC